MRSLHFMHTITTTYYTGVLAVSATTGVRIQATN
ncbi:unnamed protein product, partial [Rotaria sp. Silwood2]